LGEGIRSATAAMELIRKRGRLIINKDERKSISLLWNSGRGKGHE